MITNESIMNGHITYLNMMNHGVVENKLGGKIHKPRIRKFKKKTDFTPKFTPENEKSFN